MDLERNLPPPKQFLVENLSPLNVKASKEQIKKLDWEENQKAESVKLPDIYSGGNFNSAPLNIDLPDVTAKASKKKKKGKKKDKRNDESKKQET